MSDETTPLLRDGQPAVYNSDDSINGASDVEQQKPKTGSFFIYVVPMAIGIFLTATDGTIVVSSYAAIGNDFNELKSTSWIATAYLLTLTSFQPLYGKLSDIFGRKSCLLFAYTIFAIGSLLCGLSRNMNELIASRAFAGLGGGGMQTIVSIIMSDLVPLRSRGTWQGILNIVWATGTSAGASLGGYLSDTIGWRWVFLIQVPLAIIAALSVFFFLHLPLPPAASDPNAEFRSKLRRIDFGGAATLVISVFCLLLGLDRGGESGWDNILVISLLVAFGISLAMFGFIESRVAAEPFAPTRIIFSRPFFASYLVNLFAMGSGFAQIFHIPLYLQAVLGKSASETGVWLVVVMISSLVGSLGGGFIMQATGKYYVLTCLAYIAMFSGCVVVLSGTGFLGLPSSIVEIAIGLAITALGNGTGITSTLVSLIANAGQADQAIATAISYLFRSLGSVVGLSVGSTLVQTTLQSVLQRTLKGKDVDEIIRRVRESLDYLNELDPETRGIVRSAYSDAVQVALVFTVSMALAALISSFFIIEKPLNR